MLTVQLVVGQVVTSKTAGMKLIAAKEITFSIFYAHVYPKKANLLTRTC